MCFALVNQIVDGSRGRRPRLQVSRESINEGNGLTRSGLLACSRRRTKLACSESSTCLTCMCTKLVQMSCNVTQAGCLLMVGCQGTKASLGWRDGKRHRAGEAGSKHHHIQPHQQLTRQQSATQRKKLARRAPGILTCNQNRISKT